MDKATVIVCICFSILSSTDVSAQADAKSTRKFRIDNYRIFVGGGIAFENGSKQLTTGAVARYGFTFGVGCGLLLSHHLEVSADLLYEEKGFNQHLKGFSPAGMFDNPPDYSGPYVPTDLYSYNHKTYTTLRVIPSYKIGNKHVIRIGLGPFASKLNVYNNESKVFQNGDKKLDGFVNQKAGQTKYDFGISVNATYDFKIAKAQMFAGVLANIGLYNVAARFQNLTEYTEGYYAQVGLRLSNKKNSLSARASLF